VTTLVGINEAGKSNLLLALWKLNPAREGNIDILHDMPVSKLSTYRKTPEEVKFITAEFELDDDAIKRIEDEKNTAWPVCDTGPDKYDRLLQR
jgi:ABC-type cobalamin/Fe3+-siderophores transport system ATPase subunit